MMNFIQIALDSCGRAKNDACRTDSDISCDESTFSMRAYQEFRRSFDSSRLGPSRFLEFGMINVLKLLILIAMILLKIPASATKFHAGTNQAITAFN